MKSIRGTDAVIRRVEVLRVMVQLRPSRRWWCRSLASRLFRRHVPIADGYRLASSREVSHPSASQAAASLVLGIGPSNSSTDLSSYVRMRRRRVLSVGLGNLAFSRSASLPRVIPAWTAAFSCVRPR